MVINGIYHHKRACETVRGLIMQSCSIITDKKFLSSISYVEGQEIISNTREEWLPLPAQISHHANNDAAITTTILFLSPSHASIAQRMGKPHSGCLSFPLILSLSTLRDNPQGLSLRRKEKEKFQVNFLHRAFSLISPVLDTLRYLYTCIYINIQANSRITIIVMV